MNTPIPIASLDVVGYATSLSEAMVPTIVTPVFRLRNSPGAILFPPFAIHCGQVCDGALGTAEEFGRFANEGDVTALEAPIAAARDHELWIDANMMPHYEPIEEADETLGSMAADHISRAKLALQQGDLDEADRLAGIALCADDRRLEPLAIRAAIRRRQGREGAVKLMAKLALPRFSQDVFDTVMEHYGAVIPISAPAERPVYHVACVKPQNELEAA
jgi:hypothetical protein